MTKMIFVSLPVADPPASIAFCKALAFKLNPQFSDATSACMVWSEAIDARLLTHAKWRTFTERPLPARHLWGAFWMGPAAIPSSNQQR